MFKEIIVVEGVHDQQKLESIYPQIDTFITGGSAVSDEAMQFIRQAAIERGVILFLDPDFPGKQITNKILAFCQEGTVKIAVLERAKAFSKNQKKIGIEHASKDDIVQALSQYVTLDLSYQSDLIQMKDLIERGLAQLPDSKNRRAILTQRLHMPYCNAKAFIKYANMMHITLSQLDEVMK